MWLMALEKLGSSSMINTFLEIFATPLSGKNQSTPKFVHLFSAIVILYYCHYLYTL